jgi:hypothetical protein
VLSSARGSKRPSGSRISTHRIGTGGRPQWYQREVAVETSIGRWLPPYHRTVRACQAVCGSVRRACSVGWRLPFRRGRPLVPAGRGCCPWIWRINGPGLSTRFGGR